MDRLDGFTLPSSHPFAGLEAYQCPVCMGISYPPAQGAADCPYCNDDDDDEDGD